MPQRDYEQVIARLLGAPAEGLLSKALADLQPRPEILDLTRQARAAGIRAGVLSNSWATVSRKFGICSASPDNPATLAVRVPA
jgi:hypothetical protein